MNEEQPAAGATNGRARLSRNLGHYAEVPMLALSIAFLVVLVLPHVAEVSTTWSDVLGVSEWVIWAIFAAELTTMTYLAPSRGRYLRDNWTDVVIVVVPFLRPLRALRLLRILGVISHIGRHAALFLRRRGLYKVLAVALVLIFVCAGSATIAERESGGPIHDFGDGLWWALSTTTTVGSADTFPVTTEGKGVAVFLMVMGVTLMGIITASLAAFLVETSQHDPRVDSVIDRLERIEHLLANGRPSTPSDAPEIAHQSFGPAKSMLTVGRLGWPTSIPRTGGRLLLPSETSARGP